MIVYLLGKSPFEYRAIQTYLDIGEQQSRSGVDVRIIFLHGGVLAARKSNRFEKRLKKLTDAGAKVYYSKEDLVARSINDGAFNGLGSPINTIEMMKLAAESDTLVSVI